jgi:hypothetical protein
LFYSLFKFDYSVKKQIINDRKIYCVDTGLANAVAFRFSENLGRVLENIVFIELKRKRKDFFYYKEKGECDFVLRKGIKINEAIQVALTLSDPKTKKREIAGVLEVAKKFNLKSGLIITEDEEGRIKKDGIKIKIIPAWKWLLEK